MNKYKITAIEHPQYPWLHRIQALIDVNEKVPKGTIGGFVDSITICHREEGVGFMMMRSVVKAVWYEKRLKFTMTVWLEELQ